MAVNRKTVGTAIGKNFRAGIEADYPEFPVLKTEVGQYVAFAEALTTGTTVVELDSKGSAAKQIRSLASEIKEVLDHAKDVHRTPEAATR